MKIIDRKPIEECIDGVIIIEMRLDSKVTEEIIEHLGLLGHLEYFRNFLRPFYRITRDKEFVLKGVLGNETFQVVFMNYSENHENHIIDHLALLIPN